MPFANKNACKLPGVQTHQAQMLSLAFYPPKRKKKTSLFFLIVEVMCTPCKQILTVYKGVNRNVAGYCNFIFQREIWLLIRWGFFCFFFFEFSKSHMARHVCYGSAPPLLEPHKLIATSVALPVVLNLLLLSPPPPLFSTPIFKIQLKPSLLHEAFQPIPMYAMCTLGHTIQPYKCLF